MSAEPILKIYDDTYVLDVDKITSVLTKAKDHPVAIISINGLMRDGKSFTLNHILRYLKNQDDPTWPEIEFQPGESFSCRSGHDRETIGLNIWSEPLVIKQNGRDVAVILLDTQGFFDPETSYIQNPAIYTFSCLLSSMVIYNAKNKITEDLLREILNFSNYAEFLACKTPTKIANPSFLLLLRDFEFGSHFEFGFHGQNVKPSEGKSNLYQTTFAGEKITESNLAVRQELLRIYNNGTGIFALPHPGLDFVNDIDPTPNPKFKSKLKELVLHIVSNIVTKKVDEVEVTGETLAHHVAVWAELCKKPEFPTPETSQDSSTRLQNEKAFAAALGTFKLKYRNLILSDEEGMEDEQFLQTYPGMLEETLELYKNSRLLGSPEVVQEYSERLRLQCLDHFEEVRTVNKVKWRIQNLKDQEKEMGKVVSTTFALPDSTRQALLRTVEPYLRGFQSPTWLIPLISLVNWLLGTSPGPSGSGLSNGTRDELCMSSSIANPNPNQETHSEDSRGNFSGATASSQINCNSGVPQLENQIGTMERTSLRMGLSNNSEDLGEVSGLIEYTHVHNNAVVDSNLTHNTRILSGSTVVIPK